MKKCLGALLLVLCLAHPAFAEEATLDLALPHPASAFFLSFLPPGGGEFFLGNPQKGSLYCAGGIAGALLGYKSFDWLPPGRSPTPNDTEEYVAIAYGLAGFLLVGLISGIDASMTAQKQQAEAESILVPAEAP